MISVDGAREIIESNFKGAKAKAIYDYGKEFYLVIAPTSDGDYSDPNYIVSKSDGKYRFLNPLENMELFSDAMQAGPIKVFDKKDMKNMEFDDEESEEAKLQHDLWGEMRFS